MTAHLVQTVVAGGQIFVKGTERSKATEPVPDGAWWSDHGQKPAKKQAKEPAPPKNPDPPKEPKAPEPPARSGPGSGVDAWRAYAEQIGLEVADDASRDDIIAAVDEQQN